MEKKHRLIIIGDSIFAQLAYEFFTYDSEYEVAAFSVERDYLKRDRLCDLPVVPFEELPTLYPPRTHHAFAAVVFTQSNELRTRLYREAKAKGYEVASYVSSRASVQPGSTVGEHCFICEFTVVHPRAHIGDNVVLWSGNYVGHYAVIRNNCFTLPNAAISAFAEIGENCVIGPNATLLEHARVARGSVIEAAALIERSTEIN